MRQEAVDVSIAAASVGVRLDRCTVSRIVYDFLTKLVDGANWYEKALLKLVRGYVYKYMERHSCPLP